MSLLMMTLHLKVVVAMYHNCSINSVLMAYCIMQQHLGRNKMATWNSKVVSLWMWGELLGDGFCVEIFMFCYYTCNLIKLVVKPIISSNVGSVADMVVFYGEFFLSSFSGSTINTNFLHQYLYFFSAHYKTYQE